MERWIHLAFPVIFILGGFGAAVIALIGSPKHYEDSDNPNMQRQLAKLGKTKARILHLIGGLVMLAFGIYLLRGWLFIAQ